MALYCDWCDREITGKTEAYAIKAEPFRVLDLGTNDAKPKSPGIAAELHLHKEPCRERFIYEARRLAEDHEPDLKEQDFEHVSESEEEGRAEQAQEEKERRNRAWDDLPEHEQDRLVMETLSDDKMTNREIHTALQAETTGPCPYGVSSEIAVVTRRLFKTGELERQEGRFGKSRFRYFRSPLKGEIAEIERTFKGEGSG